MEDGTLACARARAPALPAAMAHRPPATVASWRLATHPARAGLPPRRRRKPEARAVRSCGSE
jgi:hypothetical protein